MDIFNRPPTIAEDTLQYTIQPGPTFPDRSAVVTLATIIESHVSSLLPNHIWHRDAFELKVARNTHSGDHWNIEGRMRVGDCVDDEWCVVWLLRDISQRWDVAVSVFDSDGDFLLIEAADHLPTWVTPTNSENRVWIYKGRLHIVPLRYVSPSTIRPERRRLPGGAGSDDEGTELESNSEYISVSDAIELVRDPKVDTVAAPAIERVAFQRTEGYPKLARQHLHRTKALVPKDIALALSNEPSLVQKATEAFYTRDALQLRAATRMARFPPDSSLLAAVAMTRTAYAQLMGQRFHPPRIFGEWKEREGTREWRWRDIGMKIACGFEMLYQETKSRHEAISGMDGSEAVAEARKEALRRDPEYLKYIQNLQGFGYFNGETEGSSLWRVQEDRAASQFIRAKQADNASRPSFASLVNSAISRARMQAGDQPLSDLINRKEDSDEWLTVNEHTVDSMLTKALRPDTSSAGDNKMDVDGDNRHEVLEDHIASEQASQLRDIAHNVEKFVEGRGDVEGARFEDDLLSDEGDMSDLSDSDDESTSDGATHVASEERQAAMDNLVPALEASEYGKMPASFHSNSQKVKDLSPESQMALVEGLAKQEASSQPNPMRPLIFPRDQFDGVEDSDDESEEEGAGGDEEEDEDDRPMVVGDVEVDMREEEEDFLKFSREALGISPEMWSDIVQERKGRGAFLPDSALREEAIRLDHASPHSGSSDIPANSRSGQPDSGGRPNKNPNLDSFEAVMQAMDAELSRAKRNEQAVRLNAGLVTPLPGKKAGDKGKHKVDGNEDDDEDMGPAMDAEIRAALQESSDEDDQRDEAPMDYTLMKNFLESFKSQQGLSGPVGNLVGRLGWQLPRDES